MRFECTFCGVRFRPATINGKHLSGDGQHDEQNMNGLRLRLPTDLGIVGRLGDCEVDDEEDVRSKTEEQELGRPTRCATGGWAATRPRRRGERHPERRVSNGQITRR